MYDAPDRISPRVSIRAPAWGATIWRWVGRQVGSCFNPRARVGRDSERLCTHAGELFSCCLNAPRCCSAAKFHIGNHFSHRFVPEPSKKSVWASLFYPLFNHFMSNRLQRPR